MLLWRDNSIHPATFFNPCSRYERRPTVDLVDYIPSGGSEGGRATLQKHWCYFNTSVFAVYDLVSQRLLGGGTDGKRDGDFFHSPNRRQRQTTVESFAKINHG